MKHKLTHKLWLCAGLCLALFITSTVNAQDAKKTNASAGAPSVAAAASTEQARFLADNEVTNIRLEVFTLSDTRLYDSDFKAGNLLDWRWQDQQGQTLADGAYRCLLTVKDLTGRLSQRQGILLVQNGAAGWQAPEQAEAALRDTAAARKAEGIAYFATVTNPADLTAAVLAHDGKEARLLTGSGGLSVRSGNFLKGEDQEKLRLTEEGKLEVKGSISTGEGIVFPDGTVQKTAYVASGQTLKQIAEDGKKLSPNAPAVGGSGTPNVLMKWAPNGVDAVNSSVTDLGPGGGITVNGSVQSTFYEASASGTFLSFKPAITGSAFLLRSNSLSGNIWIGHLGNVGLNASEPGSRFATGGNATIGASYYGTTAPTNGLLVQGNVGIGTASPGSKLDVVGTISTTTQYNIGANRVLGTDSSGSLFNLFVGPFAGLANPTGGNNTFVGGTAGFSNTTGSNNSFFGRGAGGSNTVACCNSFFGVEAGESNTAGVNNAFYGWRAGRNNSMGGENSFYGVGAGENNTTGGANTFVGRYAGFNSTIGVGNVMVGVNADFKAGAVSLPGCAGCDNTFIGNGAGGAITRIKATAIGAGAFADCSNCTIIGDSAVNVGIGTSSPTRRLEIVSSGAGASLLHLTNTNERAVIGLQSTIGGVGQTWTIENGVGGNQGLFAVYNSNTATTALSIRPSNNVGIGTDTPLHKLHVNGQVAGVGAFLNLSDARYKKNIQPLQNALHKTLKLRGVSYDWRQSENPSLQFGSGKQIGFIAQELESVLPEAVVKDAAGVRSVAYSTVIPLLTEAIKEQQQQFEQTNAEKDRQIEQLKQQNTNLAERLKALEQLVQKALEAKASLAPSKP